MKIKADIIRHAAMNFYSSTSCDEMLLKRIGVTSKQIQRYRQCGKIGLSPMHVAKIRLILRSSPDLKTTLTLFKAIEAKYKK